MALAASASFLQDERHRQSVLIITCPARHIYDRILAGAFLAMLGEILQKSPAWTPVKGSPVMNRQSGKIFKITDLGERCRIAGKEGEMEISLVRLLEKFRPVEGGDNRRKSREYDETLERLFRYTNTWNGTATPALLAGTITAGLQNQGLQSLATLVHPLDVEGGAMAAFRSCFHLDAGVPALHRTLIDNGPGWPPEGLPALLANKTADLFQLARYLRPGGLSRAILLVDGWLHPRQVPTGLKAVHWPIGPAMARALGGSFPGRLQFDACQDETLETAFAAFQASKAQLEATEGALLPSIRYWEQDTLGLVPNQAVADDQALWDGQRQAWHRLTAELRLSIGLGGDDPEWAALDQAGVRLVEACRQSRAKLQWASKIGKDGKCLPPAAAVPAWTGPFEKLAGVGFDPPKASPLSVQRSQVLDRPAYLLSLYGHGKRLPAYKALAWAESQPQGATIAAYPFEQRYWEALQAGCQGFDYYCAERCAAAGLLELDPPPHRAAAEERTLDQILDSESAVVGQPERPTRPWEDRLLDWLRDQGLQEAPLSHAYDPDQEDEDGAEPERLVVGLENGQSFVVHPGHSLIRCLGETQREAVPAWQLSVGDSVLVYQNPGDLLDWAQRYWRADELLVRIRRASYAWRHGLRSYYHNRGREDKKQFHPRLQGEGLSVARSTLEAWMDNIDAQTTTLYPREVSDLDVLEAAGIKPHNGMTWQEVRTCARLKDRYLITLGRELSRETNAYHLCIEKGPRLEALGGALPNFIEKATGKGTVASLQYSQI